LNIWGNKRKTKTRDSGGRSRGNIIGTVKKTKKSVSWTKKLCTTKAVQKLRTL